MQVSYILEGDVLVIIAKQGGRCGGTLRDNFSVIPTFTDEGTEIITRVDILHASYFLPLDAERSYDSATDTLTLGKKPASDYRGEKRRFRELPTVI